MSEPIWNKFLTERDKAVFGNSGYGARGGFGKRPALLIIDVNYAFCDERPMPILESIKRWRNSCGEDAWVAMPYLKQLLDKAHEKGIPVIYTTGVRREDNWDRGSWTWKNNRSDEDNASRPATNVDGNEIVAEIAPAPQDIVILKQKPSGFFGTNMASYLTLLGCDSADPRQTGKPLDEAERTGSSTVLGGVWKAGRHELAADASYREKRAKSFFAPAFAVDSKARVSAVQPRAKLVFDALGRSHDLVVGLDWEQWDYDTRNGASFTTLGSAPFSHRVGEQTNEALYAQANLWLAGRTRLVLGARAQRSEERLTEEIFPVDDRTVKHDLEAYEVALRQGFGGGWSGYGKYGSTFRLANFDDNACFGPPCAATLLDPQTGKGGELGVEYEGRGWRARAAVYDQDLENEIAFSPAVFANVNLDPTRRRGFELEAAWRAAPALDLRASFARMEAQFRDSGNTVPLVPQTIATAGLAWSFAARTRFIANARYVGAQRYDNDQANLFREMPDYALLDLKLEHTIGRVTLAAEVKNLLDEGYYSYGIWNGATSFSAYPAAGRAGYLSVAYRL